MSIFETLFTWYEILTGSYIPRKLPKIHTLIAKGKRVSFYGELGTVKDVRRILVGKEVETSYILDMDAGFDLYVSGEQLDALHELVYNQ